MASFYEMPAISPTMDVGVLVEWRVKEGDTVSPQTVVAEVATDKANMEAEIFDEGVILKLLVEEDEEIPPGFPILIWGKSKDEDISDLLEEFERIKASRTGASAGDASGSASTAEDAPTPAEDPEPPRPPKASPPPTKPSASTAPNPSVERTWAGKTLPKVFFDPPGDLGLGRATASPGRVLASPLARTVAKGLGLDLHRIQGSGPGGRIVKADVEQAAKAPARAPTTAAPARPDEVVKNSPMRKTIAKRLLESHRDIPVFYLTAVFDVGNLVAFRSQLKGALDQKISYNDLIIAAVGRALRAYPEANASWSDKAITRHGRVDVGMAVAVDGGLITPVIRDADRKPVDQIARETRELASRARDGKLVPEEYTGGTFSVSNLGMMGIKQFTAIINPPEAAILAVGAMDQRPVVVDGELTVGWRLDVTLSCDHRVLDGAVGAGFLQVLRRYIENPVLLATGT